MRFKLAVVTSLAMVSVACTPNTGHNLLFADLPKQASWEADTALQFRLQAPSSVYPLAWRLRNPKLAFATTTEFTNPVKRSCDRIAENDAELLIQCSLPTQGLTPGTTLYYRLEYTFDGHREGQFTPLKPLEVRSNCDGGWWMRGEAFGCN